MKRDVIKTVEVVIGKKTYTIEVEATKTGYTAQAYYKGKPHGVPLSTTFDEFMRTSLGETPLEELADSLIHCVHGFLLGNFVRSYMKAVKKQSP